MEHDQNSTARERSQRTETSAPGLKGAYPWSLAVALKPVVPTTTWTRVSLPSGSEKSTLPCRSPGRDSAAGRMETCSGLMPIVLPCDSVPGGKRFIGGVPMGIGIFAVWPLAKKFGKRNVTMVGFLLYALGSLICWMFPTSLVIVLVGQFIKNIGGLPCAYVFMALFADCLDHLEWRKNVRMDGAAMSIYNIIAVAMVGIMTGVFNWMLAGAGYAAPITAGSVAEASTWLAANGQTAQVALESLKPAADGVLTVALQQPDSVNWVISFAFVGLEVFTGIILAVILWFINVEKNIAREQEEIKARKGASR